MKKLQLAAVLAVGALLGYVGARSDIPLPSQAAPVKQSVSKESVADKPATARVQIEPLRNIGCVNPSTKTEPVELADAGLTFAAHNLAVAATAQASGKKPNIIGFLGRRVAVSSHHEHCPKRHQSCDQNQQVLLHNCLLRVSTMTATVAAVSIGESTNANSSTGLDVQREGSM